MNKRQLIEIKLWKKRLPKTYAEVVKIRKDAFKMASKANRRGSNE